MRFKAFTALVAAVLAAPAAATTIVIANPPVQPPAPPVVFVPVAEATPGNPTPGIWVDVDTLVGAIIANNTNRRWWDLHFAFAVAQLPGLTFDDRTGAFPSGSCNSIVICNIVAKPPQFPGLAHGEVRWLQLIPQGDVRTIRVNIWGTVPEPASWAMMIAGFGLVGTVLRRRGGRAVGPQPG